MDAVGKLPPCIASNGWLLSLCITAISLMYIAAALGAPVGSHMGISAVWSTTIAATLVCRRPWLLQFDPWAGTAHRRHTPLHLAHRPAHRRHVFGRHGPMLRGAFGRHACASYTTIQSCTQGSWLGALPMPLDWGRWWQARADCHVTCDNTYIIRNGRSASQRGGLRAGQRAGCCAGGVCDHDC